jgi:hypothetical protein
MTSPPALGEELEQRPGSRPKWIVGVPTSASKIRRTCGWTNVA